MLRYKEFSSWCINHLEWRLTHYHCFTKGRASSLLLRRICIPPNHYLLYTDPGFCCFSRNSIRIYGAKGSQGRPVGASFESWSKNKKELSGQTMNSDTQRVDTPQLPDYPFKNIIFVFIRASCYLFEQKNQPRTGKTTKQEAEQGQGIINLIKRTKEAKRLKSSN